MTVSTYHGDPNVRPDGQATDRRRSMPMAGTMRAIADETSESRGASVCFRQRGQILAQRHSIGVVPLVLLGCVVPLLAVRASERNEHPSFAFLGHVYLPY